MEVKFPRQIFEKKKATISNFMKIRRVGPELFHTDRQIGRNRHNEANCRILWVCERDTNRGFALNIIFLLAKTLQFFGRVTDREKVGTYVSLTLHSVLNSMWQWRQAFRISEAQQQIELFGHPNVSLPPRVKRSGNAADQSHRSVPAVNNSTSPYVCSAWHLTTERD
jgi:hypothetical protein